MPTAEELRKQGNQAFTSNNYAAAIEFYTRALELDKYNAVMLSNRAQCFLSLHKWEDAYSDAEQGLACNPEARIRVKLLFRKGVAAKNLNQEDTAVQSFHEVLQLDPENKAALKEMQTLPPRSKTKKIKASVEIPIPLEFVDQLPTTFENIVNPPISVPKIKETENPSMVLDIAKELFGG